MKRYLLTALIAFAISLISTYFLIPILKKLKAGQNILVYVKEHKNKGGTPTMGGLAFVIATVVTGMIFLDGADKTSVLTLAIALSFALVGFLDDFLKCRHKENLGLRAWQKFSFQFLIALFAGIYAYRMRLTGLYLPFHGGIIDMGWWVIPFTLFVFLATVNAVNLTDGLDGLASGVSVPFFLALGIILVVEGIENMPLFCFALVGALTAYLIFNVSKASVFMGDTGSLALGGFASCIACFTGNGLYIVVIGAGFVLSVVSVVLQVVYFKITGGKRIFLMSPIHHHFQQKGYSESKIAYAYATFTALMGVICILCII